MANTTTADILNEKAQENLVSSLGRFQHAMQLRSTEFHRSRMIAETNNLMKEGTDKGYLIWDTTKLSSYMDIQVVNQNRNWLKRKVYDTWGAVCERPGMTVGGLICTAGITYFTAGAGTPWAVGTFCAGSLPTVGSVSVQRSNDISGFAKRLDNITKKIYEL